MSRTLTLCAAAMAWLLAACSALPGGGLPAPAMEMLRDAPEEYVVVTVHNDVQGLPTNAASSARGYQSAAAYVAGAAARAAVNAIAADHHLQLVTGWPIPVLGVHCVVYRLSSPAVRTDVLTDLAHDRRVESAQALEAFSTQGSGYNDPYVSLQNNLMQLGVPEVQRYASGEGVKIAVIDTGVDTEHPDLRHRITLRRNFVDDDAAQFRKDLHGTAVAGVIAALSNNEQGIAGIAPAAELLAFKACWEVAGGAAGRCNSFTLAQALAAAIDAKADIVNLSLAGPGDPLLTRLVKAGLDRGMIFVGAVAPGGAARFPVNIAGVIGVDESEQYRPGNNYVAAPGRDIFTLRPAGSYDAVSGSSLSTAEISGVLALLRERHPKLTAPQAHAVLVGSFNEVIGASGSMVSVNACAAFLTLGSGKQVQPVSCKPIKLSEHDTSHLEARQESAPAM